MIEFGEAIKACSERLDRYRRPNQRIGEQNTKVMLIEPVLQALGWDLFDPEEVNREYRRRGADNPVDYALLLLRTPRLFVEAKGLGENIDDPRWANQTISYAAVAGVEWVALTDGAQWRIYNAHAPVPVEDKLFRSVDVAGDPEGAVELLELLSKENMRENRIQELWQGYFVDRQTHAVLTALFSGTEPPNDLINLISKRAERLSKDDVRASLIRARAAFDFPRPTRASTPPVPLLTQPAPPSPKPLRSAPKPTQAEEPAAGRPASTSGSSPARRKVSSEERATKFADLVRLGRIAPGILTARYDGQTWQAQVGIDGSLSVNGQACSSPSKAGEMVKIAARGPDLPRSVLATDGWEFWSVQDAVEGDVVKLKEARRRLAEAPNEGPDPGR
ncbi:hypothetical protein [Actinomycetospora soli]|uniref:restriction system modified-DNA reader domain-containing protein n=1 Tax=Actinomycetospora soli TaxID=2893887 RepID=UPI001E386CEA|nr:hypothetical protein [Actinomycetospora soli]MCD2190989.1 hypothetical protein [Actinomycetospora soli]